MKRIRDMSDEEVRAEYEFLRKAYDQADRDDAPLLTLMWAEEEDEDINPLDLN